MVVMYGAPPSTAVPDPIRLPDAYPIQPASTLVPCAACHRHIHFGTTCPFCFAEKLAKSPGRAALEAIKASLEDALKIVNQALENQP